MRTLIIAVTLFVFSNCFSQDKKEEYSDWNISVSGGIIHFLDDDIYYFNGDFIDMFDMGEEYEIPNYKERNSSLNHYELTASYFFSQNHELGITIGRSVFNSPDKFFYGYSVSGGGSDTTKEIREGYRAYIEEWLGIFYNFHYKDYLYAGIKLAGVDDICECFLVGKKFKLENSFFIKTELSYSFINSDYLWNFSSARSEKIILSFGLGLNL